MSQPQFIQFVEQQAQTANDDILQQRQQVLSLYQDYTLHQAFTPAETAWLNNLTTAYKITGANLQNEDTWQQLLSRVDVVPTSLVIAQAIEESSWGKSRFAKQGNNLFGQWCYSEGCGLVPHQRAQDATFEVKRFSDAQASVKSYMLNLNTLHLYHDFRTRRSDLRVAGRPVTGLNLVDALNMYSIHRQVYINAILQIINQYSLAKFDRQSLTVNDKTSLWSWVLLHFKQHS